MVSVCCGVIALCRVCYCFLAVLLTLRAACVGIFETRCLVAGNMHIVYELLASVDSVCLFYFIPLSGQCV